MTKYKPSVPKRSLFIIAGAMWLGAGAMLVTLAIHWLSDYEGNPLPFVIPAVLAALVIHHWGFLAIVDKNLGRIKELPGEACVFSFISWRSYIIIVIMISFGIILRHSALPKPYLSIIYLGIGLALFLSSIRYFRSFICKTEL